MISDAAFAEFYQQTAAALRKYVVRCLGSVGPADDIVQEAYLRLLRRPPSTEDAQELRAYLFAVASNLLTDRWRRHRTEIAPSDPPQAAPDPDAALQLDMQRTFLQLRPLDRQLLWLAYVEGASHREIAASLGLREASIRVLLSRAREKLLGLLEPGHHPAEPRQAASDCRSRSALAAQQLKLRAP